MLSVVMLSVVILSVVMLSVVMLSVTYKPFVPSVIMLCFCSVSHLYPSLIFAGLGKEPLEGGGVHSGRP